MKTYLTWRHTLIGGKYFRRMKLYKMTLKKKYWDPLHQKWNTESLFKKQYIKLSLILLEKAEMKEVIKNTLNVQGMLICISVWSGC